MVNEEMKSFFKAGGTDHNPERGRVVCPGSSLVGGEVTGTVVNQWKKPSGKSRKTELKVSQGDWPGAPDA